MENKNRCSQKVLDSSGWHRHQCSNKGKVERNGKLYCGLHNPIQILVKRNKQQKVFDEKQRRRGRMFERQAAMGAYFEGVSTEEIKQMKPIGGKSNEIHNT